MFTGTIDDLLNLHPTWYFVSSETDIATILNTTKSSVNVAIIDGSNLLTDTMFFNFAANFVNFPDYCGHNWDAFADCYADYGVFGLYPVSIIYLINFQMEQKEVQDLLMWIMFSMLGVSNHKTIYKLYAFMPSAYEQYPYLVEHCIADMTINPERVLVHHRFQLLPDSTAA